MGAHSTARGGVVGAASKVELSAAMNVEIGTAGVEPSTAPAVLGLREGAAALAAV